MSKAKAATYRVLLPRVVVEDPETLARYLHRVAGQLHELLHVGATAASTELSWLAVRMPTFDELTGRAREPGREAPWTREGPLPGWAGHALLIVATRDFSPDQGRLE